MMRFSPVFLCVLLLAGVSHAQVKRSEGTQQLIQIVEELEQAKNSNSPSSPAKEIKGHIPLDAPQKAPLSTSAQRAIDSARKNSDAIQGLNIPQDMRDKMLQQKSLWDNNSLEAYVNAAPPRDQALVRSILMGDGTIKGNGRLMYFVSRSMPPSLLKAYALDAFHTGALLVTKGIRKGDTIKEFIEESLEDFNSAGGYGLAGLEINPNLFDTFNITVVPTVVWTNLSGLDAKGSGCIEYPPDYELPNVELPGPDDTIVTAKKPQCQPAAPTAYYKLAGAINTPYALDRFEKAGAPKEAIDHFRGLLAEGRAQASIAPAAFNQTFNNDMPSLATSVELRKLPRRVLLSWKSELEKNTPVAKTPWGPAFGAGGVNDPQYRKELEDIVARGLN